MDDIWGVCLEGALVGVGFSEAKCNVSQDCDSTEVQGNWQLTRKHPKEGPAKYAGLFNVLMRCTQIYQYGFRFRERSNTSAIPKSILNLQAGKYKLE